MYIVTVSYFIGEDNPDSYNELSGEIPDQESMSGKILDGCGIVVYNVKRKPLLLMVSMLASSTVDGGFKP